MLFSTFGSFSCFLVLKINHWMCRIYTGLTCGSYRSVVDFQRQKNTRKHLSLLKIFQLYRGNAIWLALNSYFQGGSRLTSPILSCLGTLVNRMFVPQVRLVKAFQNVVAVFSFLFFFLFHFIFWWVWQPVQMSWFMKYSCNIFKQVDECIHVLLFLYFLSHYKNMNLNEIFFFFFWKSDIQIAM